MVPHFLKTLRVRKNPVETITGRRPWPTHFGSKGPGSNSPSKIAGVQTEPGRDDGTDDVREAEAEIVYDDTDKLEIGNAFETEVEALKSIMWTTASSTLQKAENSRPSFWRVVVRQETVSTVCMKVRSLSNFCQAAPKMMT